jgi:hypothetical protein
MISYFMNRAYSCAARSFAIQRLMVMLKVNE